MTRLPTRGCLVALAVVLAFLGSAVVPASTAAPASGNTRYDPVVSEQGCALVGRAWRADLGCSRVSCFRSADVLTGGRNSETCRRSFTNRYGTIVDPRTCVALHRRWVPSVNYCASSIQRWRRRIDRAPQCAAPFTTYLVLSEEETEPVYDECVRPTRADSLAEAASRTGVTLAAAAIVRSAVLCALRPGTDFVRGLCVESDEEIDRSTPVGTLVVGDSLTWRGTDELARLRPAWSVDGYPGRRVNALPQRIEWYLAGHADPEVLVIALGTNTAPWTKEEYLAAIDSVPLTRAVVLVAPYRRGETPNAALVATYAQWMREIVAERSNVCLYAWDDVVRRDPSLLVDSAHPTRYGDHLRALQVARTADRCLAAQTEPEPPTR